MPSPPTRVYRCSTCRWHDLVETDDDPNNVFLHLHQITISCATPSRNPRGPDTSTNTSNNDDLDEEVCGAACNGCSSNSHAHFHTMTESESYDPWHDQGYDRESRGRAFVEALKSAKDGTTIKISTRIMVNADVFISGAVRIVGTSRGRLELGFGAIFVSTACSTASPYFVRH